MPLRRITPPLALLLAALAAPSPALARGACRDAELRPDQGQLPAFNRALVCLVNRERAKLSRPRLRRDWRLARAGRQQATAVVAGDFFSHLSPGGAGLAARLRRAGYLPRHSGWMVGEVLSWGAAWNATPRAAVDAWLRSAPHRRALLDPRFRQIGAGAAMGTPVRAPGVTAAVELGTRG